ncbi:MAG: TylF/MycF/NovP-related O-methyltransferase [Candidatus Thiodiazotropha sp.]
MNKSFNYLLDIQSIPTPSGPDQLYLDLLKRALTRTLVAKNIERHSLNPKRPIFAVTNKVIKNILTPLKLELVKNIESSEHDYIESTHSANTRNEEAETMLGIKQLDQMQAAITDVVNNNIPGDALEAGVWRGGMTIFMRGVLRVLNDNSRNVWVVDSFEGLPAPDKNHDSFGWVEEDMSVSLDDVKKNFQRYNLDDENVKYLKGFFSETLPQAPIDKLSILRVDADLYESTLSVLEPLYPKLSVGGYAIFDDYQNLKDCQRAINEYRQKHNITDEIIEIDQRAIYWKKTNQLVVN